MHNRKTYKNIKEMNRRELINTCYSLIRTIKRLKAKGNDNSNGNEKVCKTIKDVINRNPEGWFAVHYSSKKEFEELKNTLVNLDFDFFLRIDDRSLDKILDDFAEEDNFNGCLRVKVDYQEVSYNSSIQHWIEEGLQVLEMSDFISR